MLNFRVYELKINFNKLKNNYYFNIKLFLNFSFFKINFKIKIANYGLLRLYRKIKEKVEIKIVFLISIKKETEKVEKEEKQQKIIGKRIRKSLSITNIATLIRELSQKICVIKALIFEK